MTSPYDAPRPAESAPAAQVAVATGLSREARLLRSDGCIVVAGGGNAAVLRSRLEAATAERRLRAVLSVGLGGALSGALALGDWVVGERVWRADGEAYACDDALVRDLQAALPHARLGAIAGSDVMLADAAAKATLHARSGALAVDMESHVAAAFARSRDLPFAALRVISDTAERALPPAALAGMRPDGGMDVGAVVAALARDPRQFPALVRTGREAEVAFRKLRLLGRHHLLGRLGVGDADLGQLAVHMV